jgi:hypothetical protein
MTNSGISEPPSQSTAYHQPQSYALRSHASTEEEMESSGNQKFHEVSSPTPNLAVRTFSSAAQQPIDSIPDEPWTSERKRSRLGLPGTRRFSAIGFWPSGLKSKTSSIWAGAKVPPWLQKSLDRVIPPTRSYAGLRRRTFLLILLGVFLALLVLAIGLGVGLTKKYVANLYSNSSISDLIKSTESPSTWKLPTVHWRSDVL